MVPACWTNAPCPEVVLTVHVPTQRQGARQRHYIGSIPVESAQCLTLGECPQLHRNLTILTLDRPSHWPPRGLTHVGSDGLILLPRFCVGLGWAGMHADLPCKPARALHRRLGSMHACGVAALYGDPLGSSRLGPHGSRGSMHACGWSRAEGWAPHSGPHGLPGMHACMQVGPSPEAEGGAHPGGPERALDGC